MPKITVWKCSRTGKIFQDREKYKKHLMSVRNERAIRRCIEIDTDNTAKWFADFRAKEQTITELTQSIIDNQEMFWRSAAHNNGHDWSGVGKKIYKKVVMPIPHLVKFTAFGLRWADSVSNSHHCPVGGVTNWHSDMSKPQGYPGWTGQINWQVEFPPEWSYVYIGADLLDGSGIHKGGGGGGGYNSSTNCQTFQYHCVIFAHDWPGLYAVEMRNRELARINKERLAAWKFVGGQSAVTPVSKLPEDWQMPALEQL